MTRKHARRSRNAPVPPSRTARALVVMLVIALPLSAVGIACRAEHPRSARVGLHPMKVDGHEVWVEVAADNTKRMTGLMYRKSLPDDRGMLFIFPQPGMRSFFMKNCLIDLDIAYIDDEGKIVDILRMEAPPVGYPGPYEKYYSTEPVRYALETNAGWFEERGIEVGATVEGYRGPSSVTVR